MILLICDHKKRELESLKRLKFQLKKKNINSEIINKHCVIKAFNYYKPKIITFPHSNGYLAKLIKTLGNKVIKILIPTEHCAFVDKFLEVQYFGKVKSHKIHNEINKIDYIFSQSNFIKNFLIKKTKLNKKKIISTGHLFYDDWHPNKIKKEGIKNIGIALTNEYILRRATDKNYLKNLYKVNESVNFNKNYWRLLQMNYDHFYFCLLFNLIEKLKKKYKVSIRTHIVDVESNFDFLKSNNVEVSKNISSKNWIKKQDLIISTTSFINVDSYIYGKPHITLKNMIPKEFLFQAYNSFNYKEFPEINSYNPNNFNDLMNALKKMKFKKNKKLDLLLKKFFSYPYLKKPSIIMAEQISSILINKKDSNFQYILNKKEKNTSKFLGTRLAINFSYLFSQIKNYLSPSAKNSYFDFFFIFKKTS